MPSPKLVCAQALEPDPTWALFLDVDGTILKLAATPNGVAPSKRVCQALRRLSASLDGAVALISGRTIDNLDRLFAPLRLPSAGLHGLERRDAAGRLHVLGEIEALEHLRPPFAELAASKKGVMLEDKGRALAIHYRKAPQEAESVRHQVDDLVRPSAEELKVLHGKMVSEVKPRHADKGSAIRGFMGEPPFEGRVPVFVGDDVTDEDGFAMVNGFDGYAIRVGRDSETAARYRLADVDQVIAWLEALPPKIRARQG
jgi:trehalose 6-phosphate phosphatase